MPCIIVGICGASGSGKTLLSDTLYKELTEEFGENSIGIICEDFYYHDQTHKSMEDRIVTNYDHPDSMDHELLVQHLKELSAMKTVMLPQYDYVNHTRSSKTLEMTPKQVIIVEGILVFQDAHLRSMFQYKIFVDTPLDICFVRRAQRDMVERGRNFDSVTKQYMATVRPMYFQFIEPSRHHSDILIPSWKENRIATDVLKARMREHCSPTFSCASTDSK